MRDALDELRALCEASLDFDEADTGPVATDEFVRGANSIRDRIDEALGFERARTRASGAPRVLDTPGFDLGAEGVDATAQELARQHLASAELALLVVDAARARDESALAALRARIPQGPPVVVAWNKADLAGVRAAPPPESLAAAAVVAVSAATGAGLDALRDALGAALAPDAEGESGSAARELSQRHLRGLARARDELAATVDLLAEGAPLDLAAEHLRRATAGLDELQGTTTPEDLLDRIFARFCLGK